MAIIYSYANLCLIPDPDTEPMLLPGIFVKQDNSRHIYHYKRALRQGFQQCLTPIQRQQFLLHYGQGLRKSEIARRQASTCSTVCKSMKNGEAILREYIERYMDIFLSLEQEFLREENSTEPCRQKGGGP